MLLLAIFWAVFTVISSDILMRTTDMALAVCSLTEYLEVQFRPNSTQKMWLLRCKVFALAVAAVFLVWHTYYLIIN
jgi:hypothetical protein